MLKQVMHLLTSLYKVCKYTEYYLVELEYFDDFEIVLGVLNDDSYDVVDEIEGIYSRIADCNKKFVESYGEDNTTQLAFRYLSLFKQGEVEDYFVYYMTIIEFGNDKLTAIATEYFS